jgi:hypothetical protein
LAHAISDPIRNSVSSRYKFALRQEVKVLKEVLEGARALFELHYHLPLAPLLFARESIDHLCPAETGGTKVSDGPPAGASHTEPILSGSRRFPDRPALISSSVIIYSQQRVIAPNARQARERTLLCFYLRSIESNFSPPSRLFKKRERRSSFSTKPR